MKHIFTFITNKITEIGSIIALTEEESFHASSVLRIKKADVINLIDGNGKSAYAEVLSSKGKETIVKVKEVKNKKNYKIIKLIVSLKSFSRLCWLVEKACEMGATHIILTDEISKSREERLNNLIRSSCKQSKNSLFPKIEKLSFNNYLKTIEEDEINIVADCNGKKLIEYKDFLNKKINLFIGSESGLSEEQIKAIKKKFSVNLGENTLRSETAFIAVLAFFLHI